MSDIKPVNMMDELIEHMHVAETYADYDGIRKKKFVLDSIKLIFGLETYNRYFPLLDLVIDSIVSISNKDITLYLQTTKKFCLPMFSSCR